MRRIVVISAALSESSSSSLLGGRLARAVQDASPDGVDVEVVELRDFLPEIAQAFTSFPPERLQEAFDRVEAADGIIAVTPIYNASYSGLFKSFFDVLPEGTLRGVPVLIAATGGTPRHSLALDFAVRPLLAYLKAEVLTTAVFAATDDWGSNADDVAPLPERISRAGAALADAVAAREPRAVSDEFDGVSSFDDMMRGLGGSE